MTKKEIAVILEKHGKWLRGEEGGERADLQGADLRCANLQGANFQNANLQGADLRCANFQNANLQGADLQGADLQGADLQGADLRCANLQGADLQGANLQNANLRGADLRDANLDYSCFPLWCGGTDFRVSEDFIRQMMYHLCTLKGEFGEDTKEALGVCAKIANKAEIIKKYNLKGI